MSDAEENTNPGTPPPSEADHEITPRDRAMMKAMADELRGGWVKRSAPVLSFSAVVVGLAVLVLGWGDARWLRSAEAKEQRSTAAKEHTEIHTTLDAESTRVHTAIKNTHTADMNRLTRLLDKEVHLRSLQGKDMEMTEKDVERLDRRLSRVEDRR